jgi:hypothetical protein
MGRSWCGERDVHSGEVYAIDRDWARIRELERSTRQREAGQATVIVRHGDFTQALDLPVLDGVLLANALHFVPAARQAETLARIAGYLASHGALVTIEYDNRPPSRWVPYPVSLTRLAVLARDASIGAPQLIGQRRSAFGGNMYACRLLRV